MGSPILFDQTIRETLSRNVTSLLRQHQLSENQLARLSGVSQKQVNNVCRQRTGCGVDAIAALARVFRIPPWLLLVPNLGQGERP